MAPKWCTFIENITEELEEDMNQVVYDDFKFLTHDEVERLGILKKINVRMLTYDWY